LALRRHRQACRARVWTVWWGWWELARVNCRSGPKWGPKWASTGLAQEALVGAKHSSTLCFFAQARILVPLWAERLSMIT
jgi:hypothetical protein